jgi:hypothetical protein
LTDPKVSQTSRHSLVGQHGHSIDFSIEDGKLDLGTFPHEDEVSIKFERPGVCVRRKATSTLCPPQGRLPLRSRRSNKSLYPRSGASRSRAIPTCFVAPKNRRTWTHSDEARTCRCNSLDDKVKSLLLSADPFLRTPVDWKAL